MDELMALAGLERIYTKYMKKYIYIRTSVSSPHRGGADLQQRQGGRAIGNSADSDDEDEVNPQISHPKTLPFNFSLSRILQTLYLKQPLYGAVMN